MFYGSFQLNYQKILHQFSNYYSNSKLLNKDSKCLCFIAAFLVAAKIMLALRHHKASALRAFLGYGLVPGDEVAIGISDTSVVSAALL